MFDDCIGRHAAAIPERTAILWKGGKVSFAKFEADIGRAAYELRDLQVAAGESVAVALRNTYLEWVAVMALARLGIASAPAADTQSRYTISDRIENRAGQSVLVVDEAWTTRVLEGPNRAVPRVAVDPDALGRVFRTSGTTAAPKRVGMSWRAIDAMIAGSAEAYGQTCGPWYLTTGPHTSFEFDLALTAWRCGHAVATGMATIPDNILALRPRLLALLPVHIGFLLDSLPPGLSKWPLRIVTAGAPMPDRLARETIARLTADLVIQYGSTETAGVASAPWQVMAGVRGAAGILRPGCHARALDERGRPLPPGANGRLSFRTNQLADGYLGDPVLTAEQFQGGWFVSNDFGHVRQDGLLVIEGRIDDVMNLGGHKTMPAIIEDALSTYPGIGEVVAFAIPTQSGLDSCGLAIVRDADFDPSGLRKALGRRLSPLQTIRWFVCDAIPRNERGKVDRNLLRSRLLGEAGEKRKLKAR